MWSITQYYNGTQASAGNNLEWWWHNLKDSHSTVRYMMQMIPTSRAPNLVRVDTIKRRGEILGSYWKVSMVIEQDLHGPKCNNIMHSRECSKWLGKKWRTDDVEVGAVGREDGSVVDVVERLDAAVESGVSVDESRHDEVALLLVHVDCPVASWVQVRLQTGKSD